MRPASPDRLTPGPGVDPDTHEVTFVVADNGQWQPRRVWYHLRENDVQPAFDRVGQHWVARMPRPPVARLEYLLVAEAPDGSTAMLLDPANPHRARGVFGDHSVIEFPGYVRPWWLHASEGMRVDHRAEVVEPGAELTITGTLQVPAGSTPDEPLPLLVVHDGPEYADLAGLVDYLAALAEVDPGLRCRALLLEPVDRDRSYSASPGYARALTEQMLPDVIGSVRTVGPLIGLGASLGGLALLHAATAKPGTFGAILSQSGSFFHPQLDAMEAHFRFYDRIVGFVESVDADPARLAGVRIAMTCGTGEDNLANNRVLAHRLRRIAVPVDLVENPDGHSYTGWRDCLDPTLRMLMTALWVRT